MSISYEFKNFIEHHGLKDVIEALVEFLYDIVEDEESTEAAKERIKNKCENLIADCQDIISKV